jgi:uncharacterized DUF497 family protein
LDFAETGQVFAGLNATLPDLRKDYGEARFITAGLLNGRVVVLFGRGAASVGA